MAKTLNTPQSATDAPTEVRVRAKMDPVAKLLGTSRTVAYRPEFAHITGSPTAGLLLSQFWYWSECPTTEKRDGWFYMTMDQISEQTGMIREEQETARKRLKAIGVLQEERRGNPGKMWFRVDEDRLYELLRGYVEIVKAGIPQCDIPAIKNAGMPQSKVRELRNVARGNATIKNAGIPQCILLESSSESSLDSSLETREDPPINPPEGEDAGCNDTKSGGSILTGRGNDTQVSNPDAAATPAEVVWESVLKILEGQTQSGQMPIPSFRSFVRPSCLETLTTTAEGATVTIKAKNTFGRDQLDGKWGDVLSAAFAQVLGRAVSVAFVAGSK
jgi:hypothetical protein